MFGIYLPIVDSFRPINTGMPKNVMIIERKDGLPMKYSSINDDDRICKVHDYW